MAAEQMKDVAMRAATESQPMVCSVGRKADLQLCGTSASHMPALCMHYIPVAWNFVPYLDAVYS